MKKFQFKSLTMRIWFILTIIIVSIVFAISLVYFFIINNFNESRQRELLQHSHEYILHSVTYNQFDTKMNKFIDLDDMHYFIFDQNKEEIHFINVHEKRADESLLFWMSGFIKGEKNNAYNQEFKETFKNQTYLFEISYMNENEFLISYQALIKDEHSLKIIMIGLLVILCGLPIAKLIANSIAKPLKQLEAYTKKIANKEWDNDLEIKSQDEIGRLAIAMNEMKQALKQADEEERKFLQSISHDLKTPVMVIMSYAQAIMDGMYVDSTENTALIIKNEAMRLEKKIKQILYLNTLDYVLENEQEQDEVYLDKLLTYLVHNFEQMNLNLNWQLNIHAKRPVMMGNSDKIRVSIENILENQLRFADKTINIDLREEVFFWVIEIINDGPLIPEKDLNQIFNHLYKGDNGNFGLGLTISQKIVHFYNGKVQVENKKDQVCFTISFPKHKYNMIRIF